MHYAAPRNKWATRQTRNEMLYLYIPIPTVQPVLVPSPHQHITMQWGLSLPFVSLQLICIWSTNKRGCSQEESGGQESNGRERERESVCGRGISAMESKPERRIANKMRWVRDAHRLETIMAGLHRDVCEMDGWRERERIGTVDQSQCIRLNNSWSSTSREWNLRANNIKVWMLRVVCRLCGCGWCQETNHALGTDVDSVVTLCVCVWVPGDGEVMCASSCWSVVHYSHAHIHMHTHTHTGTHAWWGALT